MAKILGLPKLSPTMEEGTLTRWIKREGDEVALDDIIAELETDKATMEWHAFEAGVLLKLLVPEGATLAPDTPVAVLGTRGEDISELLKSIEANASPANVTAGAGTESKPTVGESSADKEPSQAGIAEARARAADPQHEPRPSERDSARRPEGEPKPSERDGERRRSGSGVARVPASPSVRRLAREQGIDLASVHGTGPRGRIIQRDLEGATRQEALRPSGDGGEPPSRPPPKIVALSPTRRTIARRLAEAKRNIPHFYLNVDVDAGPLQRARQELNRSLEAEGEKLSFNDLMVLTCARALRRFPALNVSFVDDAIYQHQVVDIALAVAVLDGLVTPVIRDADKKDARTIAREVRELIELARSKQLKPDQMAGGTFSISNLGMYGIDDFSAIINPPQAAILAVGAIRTDEIAKSTRMRLTLSCDHRAIDGAVGAQWLSALRSLLENPICLLL
ncbi:MAG TPA: dihydrolipoamide acetyltransferase family protein [Polyangiaceae bacterium]|nr:dihydrolipoamide acetyltransferase family protein [Polyangiaceae bacterium]